MSAHKSARFVIIDGHGIIYRAYHAFPPLTTGDGTLVNAVYGFSRILLTAIHELEPEYLAVAFDHKLPTLRAKKYEAYKAHRPEMPDDLKPQIDYVKKVVDALNVPRFELEGYEADDLLGTISAQIEAEHERVKTIIVTGDKDLLQLVTDQTHVWIPGRSSNGRAGRASESVDYDPAEVQKKLGITPDQLVDLKALMGDASDNIPGIKGIGQKSALALIQAFGSLEGVYVAVRGLAATEKHPLLKGALLTKLQTGEESARLSQELALIDRSAPISFALEPCRVSSYDKEAVSRLFEELEFRSLIRLLPKDAFELGVQNALF